MTIAFFNLPRAGAYLLCLVILSATPWAAPRIARADSYKIVDAQGADITADIEGSAGTPAAVYTELTSIGSLLTGVSISAGATDFAIDLGNLDLGSFENTTTGELTSGFVAVRLANATAGTFHSAGAISASNAGSAYAGVYLGQSMIGDFTNSGSIYGDLYGLEAMWSTLGNFTNDGEIRGGLDPATGTGMSLANAGTGLDESGTFLNGATGQIVGGQRGLVINASVLTEFTNRGLIEATATDGFGLDILASTIGRFTNETGATIRGGSIGLAVMTDSIGLFVNNGTIEGTTAIAYETRTAKDSH